MELREKEIYRVTLLGTIVNAVLVLFKFLAGFIGHSSAMVADAVHSLSDFVTDIVVFIFVKISSKPHDNNHQYGHGKFETLATVIIGLMLISVAMGLSWSGSTKIWDVVHGKEIETPGVIAFIAALISIISKEFLYRYTMHASIKTNSNVLKANAWHHRSDSFSSIATTIGIGGAILLGDKWCVLDPIAAIIVSLLIMKVAFQLFLPALNELLEKSLPEDEKQKIFDTLSKFPEIKDPHNLRTRRIGPSHSIELHVRMSGDMTVNQSHEITRCIEEELKKQLGSSAYISIHVEPVKGNN